MTSVSKQYFEEAASALVSGKGGNLAPTITCQRIAETILDSGGCEESELIRAVQRADTHNETTLKIRYGENFWRDFTTDCLTVMRFYKLVDIDDGKYVLGSNFEANSGMRVLPDRCGGRKHKMVVYTKEWREMIGVVSKADRMLTSALHLLSPQKEGWRDLKEGWVAELMEKMRTNGWLLSSRIIIDKDGHIVDGRHRLEAARRLSREGYSDFDWAFDLNFKKCKSIFKLPDSYTKEQIAIEAYEANNVMPWDFKKDLNRLSELLGVDLKSDGILELGPEGRKASAMAKLEIFKDPARSDREIAKAAGVHQTTVLRARMDLMQNASDYNGDEEPSVTPCSETNYSSEYSANEYSLARDFAKQAMDMGKGCSTAEKLAKTANESVRRDIVRKAWKEYKLERDRDLQLEKVTSFISKVGEEIALEFLSLTASDLKLMAEVLRKR